LYFTLNYEGRNSLLILYFIFFQQNGSEKNKCIIQKKRHPGMKFAVGMIVGDNLLNRVGVIIGWKLVTEETKNYDFIKRYNALWYYIILCPNDLLYYMCEGMNLYLDYIIDYIIDILEIRLYHIELLSSIYNITYIYIYIYTFSIFFISEPLEKIEQTIRSNYIGLYFSEFQENYYVPNEMLAIEYPDDVSYLCN